MKKLMFAATVAAAMAGFAVESQVVGYKNHEVNPGVYNMWVAGFLPVDKPESQVVLGDITANSTFKFGTDTIMTLTSVGRTDKVYTYLTAEEGEAYNCAAGWYDYAFVNAEIPGVDEWDWESQIPDEYCGNDMTLPYGTMIIVQSGYAGATLNYAGKVLQGDDYRFYIEPGVYNMLGNATPVNRTLGAFTANSTFKFGTDTIMTLTSVGRTDKVYTYLTAEEGEAYNCTAGWYDYAFVNAEIPGVDEWDWESQIPDEYCGNAMPVDAGTGFIVQSGYDGAYIDLPKAL